MTDRTTRKPVRAVLVDPEKAVAREVDFVPGDGDQISELLGCDLFDVARLPDGHAAYVDDEGLLKDPDFFVLIAGFPPLAGRALFVGPVDEEGYETPCTLTEEWFADNVRGSMTSRGLEKLRAAAEPAG